MKIARMTIGVVAALLTAVGAMAEGVVVMKSATYTVWGDAGRGENINTYYESTGYPSVSGSAAGMGIDGLLGHATSSASQWEVYAFRVADAASANAYAENEYLFSPLSNRLSITLSGEIYEWWFENDARMMFRNVTTDVLLGEYLSPSYYGVSPFESFEDAMQPYPIEWVGFFDVDPLNEYLLTIYVGAHRNEGGPGRATLSVSIIPEPTSLLLLVLGGLDLRYRNRNLLGMAMRSPAQTLKGFRSAPQITARPFAAGYAG